MKISANAPPPEGEKEIAFGIVNFRHVYIPILYILLNISRYIYIILYTERPSTCRVGILRTSYAYENLYIPFYTYIHDRKKKTKK